MPDANIKTTEQASIDYEKKYLAISDELNKIALTAVQSIDDQLAQSGLSGKSHVVWQLVELHRRSWKVKNFVQDI